MILFFKKLFQASGCAFVSYSKGQTVETALQNQNQLIWKMWAQPQRPQLAIVKSVIFVESTGITFPFLMHSCFILWIRFSLLSPGFIWNWRLQDTFDLKKSKWITLHKKIALLHKVLSTVLLFSCFSSLVKKKKNVKHKQLQIETTILHKSLRNNLCMFKRFPVSSPSPPFFLRLLPSKNLRNLQGHGPLPRRECHRKY